jgi:hypothetical protein
MARKIRDSRLESRSARLRLPVQKKPYTGPTLARGIGLLYRRNAGAGSWVVKATDGHGATWTKAFAVADDFEDADGGHVLSYFQASDIARRLAAVHPHMLRHACGFPDGTKKYLRSRRPKTIITPLPAAASHSDRRRRSHPDCRATTCSRVRLAAVDERRIAGDHEEPAQLGKGGDDVLADAVREILPRIAGHVGEREHGDGWAVRQRQSGTRWLAHGLGGPPGARRRLGALRLDVNRANEAQALSRDRADQFLLLAAVAHRPAHRIDTEQAEDWKASALTT